MHAALDALALGFATALSPGYLLGCFGGVLAGTLVGFLPGLGPVTTIAILLPFTFSASPTGALIALAGIYYGAQYGGSITAILLNVPGEASSAVTCVDGYAMTRQGRAGLALTTAAVASFIGGSLGTACLAALSGPLATLALRFEAADYAALMACGLVAAVSFSDGPSLKGLAMAALGLLVGAVGTGVASGQPRFTMGLPQLVDGIGLVPVAIGLLALPELIAAAGESMGSPAASAAHASGPRPGEVRRAAFASLRGSLVGSLLGVLPGAGPLLASFASYAVEKRAAPRAPFGAGAIEGVAGPEAANNAAAQTSFVPLLTLGIPSNGVMALVLGALVVHGVQPGPQAIAREPTLFWGVVASMWIGNAMLLAINLPLVGIWRRIRQIPPHVLAPAAIVICCLGVYSVDHSTFDVLLAALFGGVGHLVRGTGFAPTPFLLGFVLSRPLEENVWRALLFADGNATTFLTHPFSATILGVTALLLFLGQMGGLAESRERR